MTILIRQERERLVIGSLRNTAEQVRDYVRNSVIDEDGKSFAFIVQYFDGDGRFEGSFGGKASPHKVKYNSWTTNKRSEKLMRQFRRYMNSIV